MQRFIIFFVSLVCISGCAASERRFSDGIPTCDLLSGDERAECYRIAYKNAEKLIVQRVERARKGASGEPETVEHAAAPTSPPGAVAEAPQLFMGNPNVAADGYQVLRVGSMPLPRNSAEGCMKGYNLSVKNEYASYIEVIAANGSLKPCGSGGYGVVRWVMRGGVPRKAFLIPPGGVGYYFFDPGLGGMGDQDVIITAWGGSPVNGEHPQFPFMQDTRVNRTVRQTTPFRILDFGKPQWRWITVTRRGGVG